MNNKIELTGNLVKSVNKTAKATFATIAINSKDDKVTYVDLLLVGKDNIALSEKLKKGDFIKVNAFFANYKDKENKIQLAVISHSIEKIIKKENQTDKVNSKKEEIPWMLDL